MSYSHPLTIIKVKVQGKRPVKKSAKKAKKGPKIVPKRMMSGNYNEFY